MIYISLPPCPLQKFYYTLYGDIMRLEVEFGEEPFVLTGLMLFFQSLLDNLLGFFSLGWLAQGVWGDGVLERLNVQRVSGWHQVVVVDQLDKWLDLGSLGDLLLVVGFGDLQWALLNADNDSVRERVRLGTVIVWSDNDNLLTSESTTGNDSCNVSIMVDGEVGRRPNGILEGQTMTIKLADFIMNKDQKPGETEERSQDWEGGRNFACLNARLLHDFTNFACISNTKHDGLGEKFSTGIFTNSSSWRWDRSLGPERNVRFVHTNFTGLDELSHFNVV